MPQQLSFPSQPTFVPHYTPHIMLDMGVFGGTAFYFTTMKNMVPRELYLEINTSKYGHELSDSLANYYAVDAPKRNAAPNCPGFIKALHPWGWYDWYTKFYYGLSDGRADGYRVDQWKAECLKMGKMIDLQAVIDGEDEENPAPRPWEEDFDLEAASGDMLKWMQHLLQYAWDCSVNPDTLRS
jgi:hypothetical protein